MLREESYAPMFFDMFHIQPSTQGAWGLQNVYEM